MSNFLTVFNFEFKQFFKKKSTLVTLSIYFILAFGVTFVPSIMNGDNVVSKFFSSDNENFKKSGYVVKDVEIDKKELKEAKMYNSKEEMEKDINDDKLVEGVVLTKDSYEYLSKKLTSAQGGQFTKIFDKNIRNLVYKSNAIDVEKIEKVNSTLPVATFVLVKSDGNAEQGFFNLAVVYVFTFVIYMTVIMFGSVVAINIVKEKSNRAMELLVVTVKPSTLILAKVLSISLAALVQVFAIFAGLFVGLKINLSKYSEQIKQVIEHLDYKLVGVGLIFSLTGFLMMMFLFSACASLVSKIEEVNSAITVPMLIFIGAFFANFYAMGQGGSGKVVEVLSYVPLTSYFSMITRYATASVSYTELLISYIILLLTALIISVACVKVYRSATLRYGKKQSFFRILFGR